VEDAPLRALTNSFRPALVPQARSHTGATQRRDGFDGAGFAALHEDGRGCVRGRCCVFSCNSLNARNHVGAGVPVTVDQALILSSKPAFSAAPTASSCAGRHVRVSLVLDVAVGSDASLFRGDASERTENGAPARAARNVRRRGTRAAPPPRAPRNVWRRAHESGAATICARTGALQVL